MPKSNNPVVFSEAVARRIVAAVRRLEAMPQFPPSARPSGPRGGGGGPVEGYVVSPILAANATQYGSGTVQIQIEDGDTGDFINDPAHPSPVITYNYYLTSGTIAAGTHVTIAPRGPRWRLLGADC